MSKVIVVDDVKSYCQGVCERLADMGIEAVGCYDVKKAKWLIERAGKNDVLLVDLMLEDERTEPTFSDGCEIEGITRCSS